MKTFRIRQFSWDKQRNTLYAEASMLGLKPGEWLRQFCIQGEKLREPVKFEYDADTMQRNEFFDGKLHVYHTRAPHSRMPTVHILNT